MHQFPKMINTAAQRKHFLNQIAEIVDNPNEIFEYAIDWTNGVLDEIPFSMTIHQKIQRLLAMIEDDKMEVFDCDICEEKGVYFRIDYDDLEVFPEPRQGDPEAGVCYDCIQQGHKPLIFK